MLQKLLIVVCFFISGSAYSQEAMTIGQKNSSSAESNGRLNADRIFNDLQQALPSELKSALDSMRAVSHIRKTAADSPLTHKEPRLSETSFKASPELKSLSSGMQARVEKTMAEIEKQHQQRAILFKEKNKTKQ
jgi:hypothetical protein